MDPGPNNPQFNGGFPGKMSPPEPGDVPEIDTEKCPLCGFSRPAAIKACPRCLGEGPDAAAEMDEWDTTGYYRRKAVSRAPNVAVAALCAAVAALIMIAAAITQALSS